MKNKKRLYYDFIDLQRAFDSVYRNALWYKLIKYGVDGKLLKLLRSMYCAVKSCVRHLNKLCDFLSSDIGCFQGEIMSPILFSFFLNDIEQNLQEHSLYLIQKRGCKGLLINSSILQKMEINCSYWKNQGDDL